jgi:hypothetical protein
MVDSNPQQQGRRRFSSERFQFINPSPELPKAPWEHGKSWFEINLPNLLATATQLSLLPLELVAPGVGMASGAIAGQGVKLGTQKLQGRDVSKDDLVGAGVSATTGAAQAGIQAGISSQQADMRADELAKRTEVMTRVPTPDASINSPLAERAGVGEDFFNRNYITRGGETINNPSYDQLQAAADDRVANAYFGDLIGQGNTLTEQQQIVDQSFGGAAGFNPSPQVQKNLQNMYRTDAGTLQFPSSNRPAPSYTTDFQATPPQDAYRPVPMPMSGGNSSQGAMPVVPPTARQTMPNALNQNTPMANSMFGGRTSAPSLYDTYRQQNPFFDPNNPFGNMFMSGRRY